MVRQPCFDSNGMKKGAWCEEEDNKLRGFVLRYGHSNWRLLPKYAGLSRCGKSCRLRWMNYLKPGLKRGKFTKHEEDLIIKLHAQLGNKWSAIATNLPGRTDNEIKNYWHAHINKRRRRHNPAANNVIQHTNEAPYNSMNQLSEEERASAIFALNETTNQNESDSLDHDATSLMVNNLQQSTLAFDANYSSIMPVISQPEVDLWPDHIFVADTNYFNQIDSFPPLLEEDYFYYPQLNYDGLSSSDSSYTSALELDWINIGDDDHGIISSSFAILNNTSNNCQSESSSYKIPPQEVGGLCDPFLECFDYGLNFFS